MDAQELKSKNRIELERLLEDNEKKLEQLKFSIAFRQLKNVREVRQTKKLIARLKTVLNQL